MRPGKRPRRFVAAVVMSATFAAAPAQAGLTLTPAYTDSAADPVNTPIYLTAPPGDSSRLFVVERGGRIRVAVNGVIQDTPFLDISTRVQTTGEGGLLSMAFPPDYAASGDFFVYFVQKSDGHIRIEQYTRSGANPNMADTTPTLLLDIAHPTYTNHYGGQLQWGPGSRLYAGTGDGGGSNDPGGNAQNQSSLLGKLLAIDPALPGQAQIAASGLRNPFRFSFDRDTQDLVIGDVGQDRWEEIDYVPAATSLSGLNFGWPCREGPDANNACSADPPIDPVFSYPHPPGAVAITGGVVVRDSALTPLVGRYVYADFYAGRIHSQSLATPSSSGDRLETDLPKVDMLVAFGEDADGHVYVVSLGGSASRLDYSPTTGGGGGTPTGPGPAPPAEATPPSEPRPAQPAARDVTAPLLRVRAARIQDVLRRRTVSLSVNCDEDCIVRASGTARGLGLGSVLRHLAAGRRTVFELRASKRVRRALAQRGVVTIRVRGRDTAGNLRKASLVVQVKRG